MKRYGNLYPQICSMKNIHRAHLIPLLLLAATAAATPDAYTLNQINSTHWYFESTQYDLAEGTYSYQAFANNISTANQTITYTLQDGLHQINATHWYFKASKTSIPNGTHNYQAFANNITSDYRILHVNRTVPPTPTTLTNTTGNFWVRHTWSAGAGNVTDSYNVSINSVWHNTSPAYYNNTGLSAHAWSNITVYAFNSTGTGTLSSASTSQNTQIPNNPITITNTSDWSGDEGENVYVDYDATDADSDTPTFSCNRTDLFADFSTATGKGNWTVAAGACHVNFGVSDGYGSTDNYTMTINTPPHKSTLVAPANGSVGTSTNPTLRVTVSDPCPVLLNVTFYQQGGTQIGSTQTGITNGSTASVTWNGRSYSTTYYWYAVADDGDASTQSDMWHFRTQSSGSGSSHLITITGCTDYDGNAGTQATIDFGYWNEDSDTPTFTTNATEGTLNPTTGVWTWTPTPGDVGTYHWYFRVTNAYGNSDQCTVSVTVYTTTTPLNLDATTGNFWVQHTWNAVTGADGYNVSINSVWHNQTATNYHNTIISPHGWSNITLASYNATTGVSSFISDDVQIPNNAIAITNYSDHTVTVGDNVTVDLDYADLDGDTPTFSCSRTDFFTDFDTATGKGNWTTVANGTFTIDFGVSDGHGSTDNCTITVQVGSITITESPMPIQMFALMFGMMLLLVFYSFIRVDENNYTHILTAFSGGVLSLLLGLEVFDGIDFYGDSGWLAECSTGWIGLFLCVFGGIIILYAAVHAIDVVRETSEKLR